MELAGIHNVLSFGRVSRVLQSAVVFFAKLDLLHGLEALIEGWLLALVVLTVDGGACGLGERFAEQIL